MATGGQAARLNPDGSESQAGAPSPAWVTQLYVFEEEQYLGWDCFAKARVIIGFGDGADLVLDDRGLGGARVLVECDGGRVRVRDLGSGCLLHVNGEPVTDCDLGALDVVGIGPYALKIRSKPMRPRSARQVTDVERPAARLRQHRTHPTEPPQAAAPRSAEHQEPARETAPTREPRPPLVELDLGSAVPDDIQGRDEGPAIGFPWPAPVAEVDSESPPAAAEADSERAAALAELDTNEILETLDLLIDEVAHGPPPLETPAAATGAMVQDLPEEPVPEPVPPPAELPPQAVEALPDPGEELQPLPWTAYVPDEEDEDEEEDDREASFDLLDELAPGPGTDPDAARVLQVVRLRGDQVVDCRFLGPGEAYPTAGRRRAGAFIRVGPDLTASLLLARDAGTVEILYSDGRTGGDAEVFRDQNRVRRRRQLYRCPLPSGAQASIRRGHTRYLVQEVPATPELPPPPISGERRRPGRNLLTSSLLHMVLLCVGSLFISLPSPHEAPPPEGRFVQIQTEELKDLLAKPPAPPRPKTPPEPVAPAPTKTAAAKPLKPVPPAKTVAKHTAPKVAPPKSGSVPQTKQPEVATASPDAGGGHGGNALNRNVPNVRKAGVLGALGIPDGVSLGAGEAMAAVTNLDAVATSHTAEAGLKVGALVGKLGTSRIEVPAVGLVNTKGSTEVVASAGVSGGGRVAALEKGRTGRRKVAGMVKADLQAPVQIQGGMSREEVKKVIDQHMDEISYCYETALVEDPSIVGKMTFEWKILTAGTVGEVRIQSSSIRSDTLHSCIKGRIRQWQFPKPRGGAEVLVSYPFVFDVVGF